MSTYNKTVLATGEIYHVFNRGVEKRNIFTDKYTYLRALKTLQFYRFSNPPLKLSSYLKLANKFKNNFLFQLNNRPKLVEIISYCFLPNHFHLLLKQLVDSGISRFISDFSNSYTRYFNIKNERIGPLLQGAFKAKHIEDDEYLIHVNRYIHINPAVSFLVKKEGLENYPWSSLPEYLDLNDSGFCDKKIILDFFPNREKYRQFLLDQVDYARQLEKIKHLVCEE